MVITLQARSDEAYRRLLARFVDLYATNLFNPHWGEQVSARSDNRLEIRMIFQGLSEQEARAAWKPLIDFADATADDRGRPERFPRGADRRAVLGRRIHAQQPRLVSVTPARRRGRPTSGGRVTANRRGAFGTPTLGVAAGVPAEAENQASWMHGSRPVDIGG